MVLTSESFPLLSCRKVTVLACSDPPIGLSQNISLGASSGIAYKRALGGLLIKKAEHDRSLKMLVDDLLKELRMEKEK